MDVDARAAGPTLRITREFRYPHDRLWSAWTDPARLMRWFGPEHDPASDVAADVRPGGSWRACLTNRDTGRALHVSGVYEEVVPKTRLTFSFRWEGDNHEDGPGVDTLVTVEFIQLAIDRTMLVLTQTGLASVRSADGHTEGWTSCLDRLERALDRPGFENG